MLLSRRFQILVSLATALLVALPGRPAAAQSSQSSGSSSTLPAAAQGNQPAFRYRIVPLELQGRGEATVLRVNSAGMLVGCQRRGRNPMICIWNREGKLLDGLSGEDGLAQGINEQGQIVGGKGVDDGVPFVYEGNQLRLLSAPPGHGMVVATAINQHGVVVGVSVQPTGDSQSFVFGEHGVRRLGTLGGQTTEANAIGPDGRVVGEATTRTGSRHAFLWADDRMTDLGTLGGETSLAQDINASGLIVGMAEGPNTLPRACAWENGGIRDLGTLARGSQSWAFGVNRHGLICGWSQVTSGEQQHGVLWHEGRIIDLNDRVADADSWTIWDARGISDNGFIAAKAQRNGEKRPVLLVPVAESGSK